MLEVASLIANLGFLLVAIVGAIIAIVQLRSAARDAHASRTAEMSWQVYQAYVDAKVRDARGAAEHIAHSANAPNSGEEYGERFADKHIIIKDPEDVSLDTHMRRLLRFYNQVGILVEKRLVDEDLVFALVGAGLKSSWQAVSAAVQWYQLHEPTDSGYRKSDTPRPIHAYVPLLHERYLRWESNARRIMRMG